MSDYRNQFIERFLKALFHRRGEGFVLKGGGAMRALFGDHRLTKDVDLDFTNPKRTAESLHNTIGRAIESAAREIGATELKVSRPGKGERTPKWKVNLKDRDGDDHHVEIEVSRDPARGARGAPVQVRFQPTATTGLAPFYVDLYDRPALIATKIAALLGRSVPRDVYDLDSLIAGGETPRPQLIDWAIARAGIQAAEAHDALHAHLDELDWARVRSELADALPAAELERLDAGEWDELKQRVRDYIEALLK